MIRNIAIVLAGGTGSRIGISTPKQFIKVAGKRVIEYTIDAFNSNSHIDEIAIVTNPSYIKDTENIVFCNKEKWTKVKRILLGGKERYESSLSAIREYKGKDVNLIFHDAARPLVSQQLINKVCEALQHYETVNVAIPSTDSLIEVRGRKIIGTIDRTTVWRVQTPQAFRLHTIKSAYEKATKESTFFPTDDCSVVIKFLPEIEVAVVRGEETNFKITYDEDLLKMESIIQHNAQ